MEEKDPSPSERTLKAQNRPFGETALVLGILSGVAELLLGIYSLFSGIALYLTGTPSSASESKAALFLLVEGALNLALGLFLIILFSLELGKKKAGGSPFRSLALAMLVMHAILAFYALLSLCFADTSLSTYTYLLEHAAGIVLSALLLGSSIRDELTKKILFYVDVGLYSVHNFIFIGTHFQLDWSLFFFLPLRFLILAFLVFSILSVALEEKKSERPE
jgi:glucose uptake protein GlcU